MFLPDELWLAIVSQCEPRDAWLGLRPLNRQLRSCVEGFVVSEMIPLIKIQLPIALPSYDVRQRVQGRAIFVPNMNRRRDESVDHCSTANGRLLLRLKKLEPEHYRSQLKVRWESMQEASAHSLLPGSLDGRLRWRVQLHARTVEMRLPWARIDWASDLMEAEKPGISTEWMPMFTAYWRRE
ncbi:hypothetical protein BAUCODRAFT_549876 [Baudoinia panamericana UAMH 10762]|uniref:F-box domain-containing protein n=1 Tax=Baudoinia panamericana (strain UAMH 10762) TaxID=717646 RepID=M2MSM2_BAUPA|nr:uncharacterized protein BAUCODRAFT_549876 [Baudoinia panamericana UAMH 10762]EMC94493.1 hypothetical protein BAUCODRAFT_549876 [Baudoinia panamericana UAMH 10762]